MKTWDDWSDFDLNKVIGLILGVVKKGKIDSYYLRRCPDYCDSWADMGPIIVDNGICLTSPTAVRKSKQWAASWNEDGGRWSNGDIVAGHSNPLRAAAIVFLEMNGVKP